MSDTQPHKRVITTRIEKRFAETKEAGRAALVTFITAGDPNYDASLQLLKSLPSAGADVIEIGMPFTDPMADGPAIQAASLRALAGGQTVVKTLEMVRVFRKEETETPVILMGYYNPIYRYGPERFLKDAKAAGVDGLIIVDLPPEEDEELCIPALEAGLNFIRLATPTTDNARLEKVLTNTSGFVYYVSIAGVTGTAAPDPDIVSGHVQRLKRQTDLPIAVGFGVKTPEQAKEIAGGGADGVVVGSAIVNLVLDHLDGSGVPSEEMIPVITDYVRSLAEGIASTSRGTK